MERYSMVCLVSMVGIRSEGIMNWQVYPGDGKL